MSVEECTEMEAEPPPDMFSIVWVKVEEDEDGVVEGVDGFEKVKQVISQQEHGVTETDLIRRERSKAANPRKKNLRLNNFQCDYCDYKTSYKNALKFHVMKHTSPKPLSCDQCEYTTKYPSSLQWHIIGKHKIKDDPANVNVPMFRCSECPYTTIVKANLVGHKRKHMVEKNFKCDKCQFSSAYKHSYIKHSKTHKREDGPTYQCDKCAFVTKYEGHISRHLAQIHKEVSEKANKCDHCEFSTRLKWRLNIHTSKSRLQNPVKCDYCEFVAEYKCAFKRHQRLHVVIKTVQKNNIVTKNEYYQPQNKQNRIKTDDSITSQLQTSVKGQYLLDHACQEINWHSIVVIELPGKEKPFQCTQCQFNGRYKASVQRHFQRHHTSKESKPYKCIHCNFATKTKDQISLHVKRSKSIFLIQCKECDFTTHFKCQHTMHQKIHYPYKCKDCDYTCKQNFDVQRHYSLVHLGHGLKCRFCDHKATTKECLNNHECLHTGIKPFKCGYCEYSTIRKCSIDNHIKRNH